MSTNISATINLVNKDAELLWVSALSSPTDAGYYKLALSLANIAQLPVSPLPQATYPELSREVARQNWDNVRYVLRQGSRMAFAYTATACLGLLLFGRLIIQYIYTPEFLPAYPALLILMAGLLVANTFYWNRQRGLFLRDVHDHAGHQTIEFILPAKGNQHQRAGQHFRPLVRYEVSLR